MPELLGQLLQVVDDVQLGASATFRHTSDGWRIVQKLTLAETHGARDAT